MSAGPDASGPATSQTRYGVAAALSGFSAWGLSPVYWKLLVAVGPLEILAHRLLWSVLFTGLFMARGGKFAGLIQSLKNRRVLLALAGTTALISVNWVTFLWAVANDKILEASLGYFMNPLVSVALGFLVLRERLNRYQWAAVALACIGVTILTVALGVPPLIPLMLAVSFGLYGLLRKTVGVGALEGLFAETAACVPLALLYVAWLAWSGNGAWGQADLAIHLLLIGAGPVTAVPLLLFSLGARRLRLSTIGLTQYVAPTIQFALAVFVFGETLTQAHLLTFTFIWLGLGIFTWDSLRRELRLPRTAVRSG